MQLICGLQYTNIQIGNVFMNKKFIKYIYIVIFCSMYGFIFPLFLLSNTQGPDHLLFSNNIQNIKSFVVFEDFSKCRLQSVLHQI